MFRKNSILSPKSVFVTMTLIGLIALTTFNTGCSSSDEEEGVTTIRFWHAMGGPLGEVLGEMIDDFNESHPHIRVRHENLASYANLEQKLLASLIARNNPDIAQMYEAVTLKMAEAGRLVQLDSFIDEDPEVDRDDIVPVMLENVTFQGKIWSFPFNKSLPVLYYNRDLFREAGLDPDQPPQTWDEFIEYAKILTVREEGSDRPSQWGTAFPAENAWLYFCTVLQNGGQLYDPETNTIGLDSPEAVEALQMFVDLIHKHKVAYTTTGFNHQNDFLAGQVAMITSSVVSKVYMQDRFSFDWGMVPIPQGRNRASILSGTNVSIFNSNPEREKAAWEFIKWFSSPENSARWSLGTTYMPVRQSAIDGPVMQEAFEEDPRNLAAILQLPYAQFEPRISTWYGCRQLTGSALEEAMHGRRSPEEILKEKVKEMNAELARGQD